MPAIVFCIPSIIFTMILAIWGLLQLWWPQSTLGWVGMSALWLLCLIVDATIHGQTVGLLVPEDSGETFKVVRSASRLDDIAKINEALIDNPNLKPKERIEPF